MMGDIVLRGTGRKDIGGAVGAIGTSNNTTVYFNNCRYEGGSLSATGEGAIYIGGFGGRIGSVVDFTNCRVEAGTITAEKTCTTNLSLLAGGFAAVMAGAGFSDVSGCYSKANIKTSALNADRHFSGGFVGESHGFTIRDCYATGFVHNISTGIVSNSYTGGFAGNLYSGDTSAKISNCYTSGNILAEGSTGTGTVSAGGIAGCAHRPNTNNLEISNCFSLGTVTALAANTGGTVYAGGILGRRETTGTVSNCVALGTSVTVMGGIGGNDIFGQPRRMAARIYAYPSSNIGSGNYAGADMLIETGTVFNDKNPDSKKIPFTDAGSNTTGPHGETVFNSRFKNLNFWETDPGFNSAGSYTGTTPPWDFNSILEKGYPILAGLGGQ